jgi:hypothetical protein
MGLLKPDTAAHGLDAINREHGGRKFDRKPGDTGPVCEILPMVSFLCWHWIVPSGIDAGINGIEYSTHKDRTPLNMLSKFRRQGLNVVECEVTPGAGAIEKEVDHCVDSSFGQLDKWNDCYIFAQ